MSSRNRSILIASLIVAVLVITFLLLSLQQNTRLASVSPFEPYMHCNLTNTTEKQGYVTQRYGDEGVGSRSIYSEDGRLLNVFWSCDVFDTSCTPRHENDIDVSRCAAITEEEFSNAIPNASETFREYRNGRTLPME